MNSVNSFDHIRFYRLDVLWRTLNHRILKSHMHIGFVCAIVLPYPMSSDKTSPGASKQLRLTINETQLEIIVGTLVEINLKCFNLGEAAII